MGIIEERRNEKGRKDEEEKMNKGREAGMETDVGGGSREESVEEGCEDGAKLNKGREAGMEADVGGGSR